jgi:hypothetical protein
MTTAFVKRIARGDRCMRVQAAVAALLAVGWAAAPAIAQETVEATASDSDLAKDLANPVASLVSVPFQFNWDQPVGVDDDSRYTLNIQPVIPLNLSEDWNLIVRWIMPYVSQPRLADGVGPTSGFSDIVASFFLSPAKPGALTWGVGPVFLLPTTSDPLLGTGKWGAGPTAVVLRQSGGLTFGMLANHLWSFAGSDSAGGVQRSDVNRSFVQPFLAWTTPTAWTFTVNAEASADWEADDTWTVPLHLIVSKLVKLGPFPMSIGGGPGFYLAGPEGGPDWRLRLAATILLPRT